MLAECAHALAHGDGLAPTLQAMLDAIAEPLDIGSAAVVVPRDSSEDLEIVAAIGLDAAAAGGLTAAMRNAGHPIVRTFATPLATYDVTPMNPGGPALRSHLPLEVDPRWS